MNSLAFQQLQNPELVTLTVAVKSTNTRIDLPPTMWNIQHNNTTTITTYHQNNFPLLLTDTQMQQLHKVYSTCIPPSQYLPQLFILTNAKDILQIGEYDAEVKLKLTQYTTIGTYFVPQHCRHLLTMGTISFLLLSLYLPSPFLPLSLSFSLSPLTLF
jgi:hypothetical protein